MNDGQLQRTVIFLVIDGETVGVTVPMNNVTFQQMRKAERVSGVARRDLGHAYLLPQPSFLGRLRRFFSWK